MIPIYSFTVLYDAYVYALISYSFSFDPSLWWLLLLSMAARKFSNLKLAVPAKVRIKMHALSSCFISAACFNAFYLQSLLILKISNFFYTCII